MELVRIMGNAASSIDGLIEIFEQYMESVPHGIERNMSSYKFVAVFPI